MSRFESWLSHISTLVVGVSGILFLWMKYFMQTDDPFALVNHPWQPTMMSIHVLAAPALTFVLGMLVTSHVRRKLGSASRQNRKSGLFALLTVPAMVVSGYVLQVSTSEWLTQATLVVHLASSGVFALSYIAHQIVTVRMARTAPAAEKSASLARRQPA